MGAGLVVPALLLLCACVSPPPKPACSGTTIDLLGQRALAPESVFDARSLPYFRVRGASGAWHASLIGTATIALGDVASSTRATSLGTVTFLRLASPPKDIAAGTWKLQLAAHREDCESKTRWTIRWGPPPEDLPALAPIAALKARSAFAEIRATLEPKLDTLDPWTRLWAAQEIARAYQAEGDLERSAEAWKRTAALAESAGVPTQASWALRSAAFQCWWLRCSIEAMPLLDRAEALDRAAANEIGLARTGFYRGMLAQELGEYRRARALMESSRQLAHDLGRDDDEAKFTMQLAMLLTEEGRYADARTTLERAGRWFLRDAAKLDRAKYMSDFGWMLMRAGEQSGDFTEARQQLLSTRALARELEDPMREANVIINLAHVAFDQGDTKAARAAIEEARALGPTVENVLVHPEVQLLEALIAKQEGRLAEAETAFARIEALSRTEAGGRDSDYTWRARYGIGQVRRAKGDVAGALRSFRAAIEIIDRVGRQTLLQESRAPFYEDRERVAAEMLELSLAAGDLDEAFFAADASLARVLSSLETEVRAARLTAEARGEWSAKLAAYLRERGEYDRAKKKESTLAGRARRAFLAEQEAGAKRLRKSFDELYAFLDERSPEAVPAGAHAEEVRSRLAPGAALLEYGRFGGRRHSFLVTQKGVLHAELDRGDRSDRGGDLLAPWRAKLRGVEQLYVVTGGLEEARRIAELELTEGRRLIEGTRIALLPHAGFLRAVPPPSGERSLIVADPSENLPHAREEARVLAKVFGGAAILSGEAATRTAVLLELEHARVFHFAGHGVLEGADPWAAHLALARDETLGLEDLLVVQPRARIVALSGCDTGRSQPLADHVAIGLAEAFLVAGAGAVLAADRPVGDSESARFMESFYRHGGADRPSEAYREAALEALRAGDSAWTAFHLFGVL